MIMTPGLGFFYGGLVRRKNVLSTVMHSFFILCLISVQWVLWGYSLAFGPDWKGFGIIGDLSWIGLNGVGLKPNADYAATVPHQAYMVFQLMFAVITPALISGAFAERKRFKAFVLFSLLWATFVYDPLAHWVWGHGGWLNKMGALDFAGGTVVHISSGVSALVAAWVLGRRITHTSGEDVEPHDIPMVVLGCALLWFGWFGFNAGSALAANGLAVSAFVNTNTAAAMAALTWLTISWAHKGVPSVVGATAGAVAGLVAITPAAGYVTPARVDPHRPAGFRGLLRRRDAARQDEGRRRARRVGRARRRRHRRRARHRLVRDRLDQRGRRNGLFYGNPKQLWIQTIAVLAAWVFSGAMTFVILKVVNVFVPLRVSENEEAMGLDLSQHSEVAYSPS